ncbi:MAG: hypothetical protein QXY70_01170, partial [Nanopusillaceae archaeon]
DNNWHVISVRRYSNNTFMVFLDGTRVCTATDSTFTTSNGMRFAYYATAGWNAYLDYVFVRKITSPEPTISIGNEESIIIIIVYSPENITTYYTNIITINTTIINLDPNLNYSVKFLLNNNEIYFIENLTGKNDIVFNYTLANEGTYNLTVIANIDLNYVKTSSVIFTLNLYDLVVSYSNFTLFNNSRYADTLSILINYRCGYLGTNTTIRLLANNVSSDYIAICNGQNKQFSISYRHVEEGLTNIAIALLKPNDNTIVRNSTFSYLSDLFPPDISIQGISLVFGFYTSQPNGTAFIIYYDSISPYLNCSIDLYNIKLNQTINASQYNRQFNYTYTIPFGESKINIRCIDITNKTIEASYAQPIYLYKLLPVDEETGVYNTSLWHDYATNRTALIRFLAVSDIFQERLIFERINKEIYLLVPTNRWILRVETIYTNNMLSSVYHLKDYYGISYELPVCIPANRPQLLQTVYTIVPIEKTFIVRKGEIGCIKAISQAKDSIGNYFGFYFYTLPGLYTIGMIENSTEIFISAIRGENENLIDIQKILYQFQKIVSRLINYVGINIRAENNTTIIEVKTTIEDHYLVDIIKDNNIIYQHRTEKVDTFVLILSWKSLNINSTDILKIRIYDSNNKLIYEKTFLANGREIKYKAIITFIILVSIMLFTFFKPLSTEVLFALLIVNLFVSFLMIPYTEPNIYVQMLAGANFIILISLILISTKLIKI